MNGLNLLLVLLIRCSQRGLSRVLPVLRGRTVVGSMATGGTGVGGEPSCAACLASLRGDAPRDLVVVSVNNFFDNSCGRVVGAGVGTGEGVGAGSCSDLLESVLSVESSEIKT